MSKTQKKRKVRKWARSKKSRKTLTSRRAKAKKKKTRLKKKKITLAKVNSPVAKGTKPSKAEIKKLFYEIIKWIKKQGCKVYVHKNSKRVHGSNGYFSSEPKPHIRAAIKGRPWDRCIQLIIHEFCHYWQWKEGFLGRKDDEGNIIYGRLLEGEELTPKERQIASTLVRISEYDCEKRTGYVIKKWNLETVFPVEEHRRSSATYNRHIVWSIGDKRNEGSGVFYANYDKLANKLWGNKRFTRWMSNSELLSSISSRHRDVFNTAARTKRKGTPVRRKKRRRKGS